MITLSKIAKLAHVSVSTVSKAFSMSPEVNEQTRELIFSVAREHGCFKKYYNAKYPKFVVAVICPEFRGRFYSRTMAILQEQFKKHNFEVCVATTDFSEETELELIRYYNYYSNVDAVIIVNGIADLTGKYDIPVISICPISSASIPDKTLTFDNDSRTALFDAIKYLIDRKAERIGFISEKLTLAKAEMFKDTVAMLKGNCDESLLSVTDKRFEEGGYDAMQKLFESGNVPEAVICAYDYMAIGAMRCILDHGLKIPEDIAVIGMNNIPECEYLNPPLASIGTVTDQICRDAVDTVVAILEGEEIPPKRRLANRFIPRRSAEY